MSEITISPVPIPEGAGITLVQEPVLSTPGLIMLSPLIASVIARWTAIEQALLRIHTVLADGDADVERDFDELRGWDRKSKAICLLADASLDAQTSDRLKAVLKLASAPAAKRHELVHRSWAIIDGRESELALLPDEIDRQFGRMVLKAKKLGTNRFHLDPVPAGGRMVAASHLRGLIAELELARRRLDDVFYGHLVPEWILVTPGGTAEYRERLSEDGELASRTQAIARERKRTQRAQRRASASG